MLNLLKNRVLFTHIKKYCIFEILTWKVTLKAFFYIYFCRIRWVLPKPYKIFQKKNSIPLLNYAQLILSEEYFSKRTTSFNFFVFFHLNKEFICNKNSFSSSATHILPIDVKKDKKEWIFTWNPTCRHHYIAARLFHFLQTHCTLKKIITPPNLQKWFFNCTKP